MQSRSNGLKLEPQGVHDILAIFIIGDILTKGYTSSKDGDLYRLAGTEFGKKAPDTSVCAGVGHGSLDVYVASERRGW